MKIKLLGIDPSLTNFGFAKATLDLNTMDYQIDDLILVETGNETTKQIRKNSDDLRRARELYIGLMKACQGMQIAIAEVPHGSQSARAMTSYGMCLMALAAIPIPLIQVSEAEVKLAAINEKYAAKEEMIEWAMAKFPTAPWLTVKRKGVIQPVAKNEHLADAVGSIEAGIRTDQFRQATALYRAMAA